MKTNTFLPKKSTYISLLGLLTILMTSCGSYQNSSYYESDGIYGGNTNARAIERESQAGNNNYYKDYFSSLQNDNQSPEIFTDIDNYNYYDGNGNNEQGRNYAGWGNNAKSVIIYNNGWGMNNWYGNNWGMNNWGMNNWGMNSWYGNNWGLNGGFGWGMNLGFGWNNFGWGNPYYGFGYSNFGWGYPYYGFGHPYFGYSNYNYNRNYSYNPSRRGSSSSNDVNRNYAPVRSNTNRNSDNIDFRRNSTDDNSRTNPIFNRRFERESNPNYTPNRTRTEPNSTRREAPPTRNDQQNYNNSRNESYSPNRSSYPSPSRSSSSGGSRRGGD